MNAKGYHEPSRAAIESGADRGRDAGAGGGPWRPFWAGSYAPMGPNQWRYPDARTYTFPRAASIYLGFV